MSGSAPVERWQRAEAAAASAGTAFITGASVCFGGSPLSAATGYCFNLVQSERDGFLFLLATGQKNLDEPDSFFGPSVAFAFLSGVASHDVI